MRLPRWRRAQDRQLDEELRSHLAMAIEDRIDRGESREQATAAARREFGNELLVRETVRDTWGWTAIEQGWQDVGYACRSLWKAPAFTAAAVLTLGLGIGANTAMFSVVRAVVLRPLPFPDPDRLVALNETDLRGDAPRRISVSWPNFFDWQREARSFEAMAGHRTANVTVTGVGPSRHVPAAIVSPTLFDTLGVHPARGRAFREEDDRAGADVVIVSDEFQQSYLGADAHLVGRPLTVNGRRLTVVGVMPPGFRFPITAPSPQVWLPSAEDARAATPDDEPFTAQRGAHIIQVVARLKPGVGLADAQAELEGLMKTLADQYPDANANRSAQVTAQLEAVVGQARQQLWLLLAAVVCVLLIACVNLANLMTGRGVARQPELALRAALGASRLRVIRLLLVEAAALAAAATVCGVGLAWWSLDLLVRLAPRDVRGLDAVSLDPMVLGYTAGSAAVCAMLIGLLPALRSTRGALRQDVGASRTSTSTRAQRRWLGGLVVLETALGVVLLVAATLVLTGMSRLARTDPGFDVSGVASLRIALPDSRYPYEGMVAFYDRLLPELAGLPGVERVAIAGPMPLGGSRFTLRFELPGDAAGDARGRPSAGFAFVSPGYFQTMRIALLRGREFTASDADRSPRVAIVNDTFARRFFPGEDPIGQRIKPGLSTTEPETPWREVVGVVSDVKEGSLIEEASPALYVPYAQGLITAPHIIVRAPRTVEAMPEEIRKAVARIDPELAVYDSRTLQDRLTTSMASERFATMLLSVFAGLGLLLTAVGLYAVLAYGVAQRTHEFGVRLALGAKPRQIVGPVLGGALALVGTGLLIGAAVSAAITRLLISVLDFVAPPEPEIYGLVAFVFLAVSVAAAFTPARRAMRVDPMRTLRAN